MNKYSHENLNSHMRAGQVYRRAALSRFSNALDRDLDALVGKGLLSKLATGLYYKPAESSFGKLPPKDEKVVEAFLNDNKFLLYTWNLYNSLGLGLTQLYNRVVVLNNKRHGVFKLGNKEFYFKRSNKGFPRELSPEFLLVDVVNNLSELTEDTSDLKEKLFKTLCRYDMKKITENAKKYGKIRTKRLFEEVCHQYEISTSTS